MASMNYRDSGDYGHEGAYAPHSPMGEAHPAPVAPPNPMQRWINLAGAATSVALICGVVVWGYKLAVRDVSGVPVIRAMEGPARIAPEDPGGDLARHVGLSVNAVAGTGTAAPAPNQVALAPDLVDLTDEDVPMGDIAALAVPEVQAEPEAQVEPVAFEPPAADTPAEAAPDIAAAEVKVIPASVPGVSRSPRPMARPARDLVAEAAAQAVAGSFGDPAPVSVDIDPASLPEGTRLAQLGAFDSVDLAKAEWGRVAERFETLMDGKKRVIQEASSGGRTFYRLRVQGFTDVAEARRFCAALQAEQTNCIPALVR